MAKKTSVNPLEARLGLGPKKGNQKTSTALRVTKNVTKNVPTTTANPLLLRLKKTAKKKQGPTTAVNGDKKQKQKANPLLAALNGNRGVLKNIKKPLQTMKSKKETAITTKHNKNTATKPNTTLSIKNASQPKFLLISNLENGTSTADLKTVLQDIGPIDNVSVRDLPSGSTEGQVVFKHQQHLQKAYERLNGVVADGRVIKASIR